MKASISWLEEYVDLTGISPLQLAESLTLAGLEVEGLFDYFDYLKSIKIVEVIEVKEHPQADNLSICKVNSGSENNIQVVCGASNVRQGMLAAWAAPGAILPGSTHPLEEIELRGIKSAGMLCSEIELGLGAEADEIMELKNGASIGQDLHSYSKHSEWVLEIGVTPNRGDALSILGLARDLAAIWKRPLKRPDFSLLENNEKVENFISVEIKEPQHAYRYVARTASNVKVAPSPMWLVKRLNSVGLRSINNVVDISNYVMIELGQPIHIFDLKTIDQGKIVVDLAYEGQEFITLDNQKRALKADYLMISDGQRPIALAGVMGGLNSEVIETTSSVLIESACFNPATVRKCSRAMGFSTDASYRYERGVDPEIALLAANRVAQLLQKWAGAEINQGYIDVYPAPAKKVKIDFSLKNCNRLLGATFKDEDILKSLESLGVELERQENNMVSALAPTWRLDLTREIDLIEEVARILGYHNILATVPVPPGIVKQLPKSWQLKDHCRRVFEAWGFSESITYSFINEKSLIDLEFAAQSPELKKIVRLINPLTQDQAVLRTSLLPNLLNAVRHNKYHGVNDVALYEIGAIFLATEPNKQPQEIMTIGGIWTGAATDFHWNRENRDCDLWDLSGLICDLAQELKRPLKLVKSEQELPFLDLGEVADIVSEDTGKILGYLGRLKQKVTASFGLKRSSSAVYVFILNADSLFDLPEKIKSYSPPNKFPSIEKDLAFIFDNQVEAQSVIVAIEQGNFNDLIKSFIFDFYEGEQLEKGKKSLALRFLFQNPNKTLTDEEVATTIDEIIALISNKFQASLR